MRIIDSAPGIASPPGTASPPGNARPSACTSPQANTGRQDSISRQGNINLSVSTSSPSNISTTDTFRISPSDNTSPLGRCNAPCTRLKGPFLRKTPVCCSTNPIVHKYEYQLGLELSHLRYHHQPACKLTYRTVASYLVGSTSSHKTNIP
jgi:hypothetical protein